MVLTKKKKIPVHFSCSSHHCVLMVALLSHYLLAIPFISHLMLISVQGAFNTEDVFRPTVHSGLVSCKDLQHSYHVTD